MFGKQTIASALTGVVVGAGFAHADPAPAPPDGVVSPQQPGKPTGQLQVGAGYATDDGFIVRAKISQSNLFGTGDLLELDAGISERRALFDAHFADPHLLDTNYRLDLHLYDDNRVLPGFTREAVGASAQLSTHLTDHLTAFAGYKFEHVDPVSGSEVLPRALDPSAPIATGPNLYSYDLSAIRAGLAYSNVDTPLAPRRGMTFGASLEMADPLWGSGIRYTRADAYAAVHQPLGPLTVHLYGRFSAIGSSDADGVPAPERLYLDGSRDLPGFAPGSLGPLLGGNLEAVGRAELEVPLVPRLGLSLIGFYGAASVYDWKGNGGLGQSTGLGIQWRSPLGILRVDYAIPLGGGAPGLVFGIGERF